MIYLIDSNVCARYLNGKSPAIREHLRAKNIEDIAVCSVVKGELFYGAMKNIIFYKHQIFSIMWPQLL